MYDTQAQAKLGFINDGRYYQSENVTTDAPVPTLDLSHYIVTLDQGKLPYSGDEYQAITYYHCFAADQQEPTVDAAEPSVVTDAITYGAIPAS